jgi:hypothetical protein
MQEVLSTSQHINFAETLNQDLGRKLEMQVTLAIQLPSDHLQLVPGP